MDTDALVVGSGFGASVLAARLSGAGWNVLVLEKGSRPDFRRTQSPSYLRRYLKSASSRTLGLTWAEALGGGSGFYEMVSLRAPSLAFEDGWPAGLSRAALDPYYARAERELHVTQIEAGDVPRTGLVFARMLRELGHAAERARYAVRDCPGSGFCVSGCVFGAKQTLLDSYLRQAERTGAVIRCNAEVVSVSPRLDLVNDLRAQARRGDVDAVPLRWQARLADGTVARARFVFVGAGTVGSAALLLRSGLPRISGALGRHVSFNGSVKRAALLPADWPGGDMYTGRSHPGIVTYDFLASHGVVLTAVKALPIQAVTARLRMPGETARARRMGAAHVEMMRLFRRRVLVVAAFGLTPGTAAISVDESGRPRVALTPSAELRAYESRTRALLDSLFTRAGFTPLDAEWLDGEGGVLAGLHFSTAHQLGSCRMADDPAHGVVDADGEVFHYPGLFVCDGAAIPGALAVNPSLTIAANAERIAERVLRRYRGKGDPR